MGLFTDSESFFYETTFGEKLIERKAYNSICKCLLNIKNDNIELFFSEFYKFKCSDEEARDNLFGLLFATADYYGGFHFENSSGDIPCFGGADIRFPFGKKYFICYESKNRKHGIKIFIDTELVESFEGTMENFNISFKSGSILAVEAGIISVYVP